MLDLSRFKKLDLLLISGIPGAGKSYFVNHFFKDSERKRVSRRDIRKMLYEMTNIDKDWKEDCFSDEHETLVRYVEKKIIGHILEHHKTVLIENTNVTESSRRSYIQMAKLHHKKIGIIYLDVLLSKCVNRNQEREDQVPQSVIINLSASAVQPRRSEGFTEVLILEDSNPTNQTIEAE